MTRRDFKLIAAAVREIRDGYAPLEKTEAVEDEIAAVDDVARALAGKLAGTNPRFDRARFLDACGVD